MLHQLQQLMGSPSAFNKLEITSVVVVAIVAGMVIGGLVGTPRRIAGVPLGYSIASRRTGESRVQRTSRSNADRTSGVAFAGWSGAGRGDSRGSGQWVNLSAAATYQAAGFPHMPAHIPSQQQPYTQPYTLQHTMVPTTMLPLAALPSAASPPQGPHSPVSLAAPQSPASMVAPQSPAYLVAQPLASMASPQSEASAVAPQSPASIAPQSPVALVAPQSPAFLLMAPQSPAAPQSDGSPLLELQPVAFLPGIYQATTYRLDVTGRPDTDEEGRARPLWRLGNVLFSAARGKTARAVTPPAGSPPVDAARPGRHRASRNKRVKRTDKWMRD